MLFADLNAAVADTFGDPVTVHRPGFPPVTVSGIFDSRHYLADAGDSGPVSVLQTTVAIVDTDLTVGLDAGGGVERGGVSYRVTDRRPDGQGLSVYVLERV